jgi:hypothetical protein
MEAAKGKEYRRNRKYEGKMKRKLHLNKNNIYILTHSQTDQWYHWQHPYFD